MIPLLLLPVPASPAVSEHRVFMPARLPRACIHVLVNCALQRCWCAGCTRKRLMRRLICVTLAFAYPYFRMHVRIKRACMETAHRRGTVLRFTPKSGHSAICCRWRLQRRCVVSVPCVIGARRSRSFVLARTRASSFPRLYSIPCLSPSASPPLPPSVSSRTLFFDLVSFPYIFAATPKRDAVVEAATRGRLGEAAAPIKLRCKRARVRRPCHSTWPQSRHFELQG